MEMQVRRFSVCSKQEDKNTRKMAAWKKRTGAFQEDGVHEYGGLSEDF